MIMSPDKVAQLDDYYINAIMPTTPATAVAAEISGNTRERQGLSRRVIAGFVGVAAFASLGIFSGNRESEAASVNAVATTEAPVDTNASTSTTSEVVKSTKIYSYTETADHMERRIETAKAERVTGDTEDMTDAEVEKMYGNIITGSQSAREVGRIDIRLSDEETSKQNFYADIRHNPQTLAFYASCLDQEVPNYENCAAQNDAEGSKVLKDAGEMLTEINAMELREKAKLAESVIAKFEAMKFEGVKSHNGSYATMRLKLDAEGNVIGFEQSTNNRSNDPRLHFTYVDKDGNVQEIIVRGCTQITEDIDTPETPTTVPGTTTPATTVPETTVPETTVPGTTTTTTQPTTTSSTTTTTQPTTTSSSTTTTQPTTTSSTTTTTQPTTTTSTTTTTTIPHTTTTTTTPPTTTSTTIRPEVTVPVNSEVISGPGAGGTPDTDNNPNNNVTTSQVTTTTVRPNPNQTTTTTIPPRIAPPSVTSTSLVPVAVE